jgi:hypothetical protein
MTENSRDILERIWRTAAKRILFLPHALRQMNAPERMISTREVRTVVFHGMVIGEHGMSVL